MKRSMLVTILLLAAASAQAGELKLELYGKGLAGKHIRIALYAANAPEQFPSEKFYRRVTSEALSDRWMVTVPDLPPGKYAVAAYADANNNGNLDKNFLGVPTEIYGFSNNARGKFGPPDFSAAAFEVGGNVVTQSIQLH